ncbi:hypothetical protein CIB84_000823 [Bambusicola thoracicus]|uniref:Uncharacterized protein n=1 Tax=Bambusicola thoracicus TaxID=9083 RepID=A0A2P4TGD0_BAMTH|nr:hypothetical protein CIB84_000823 [Bambusicola thoracicus]
MLKVLLIPPWSCTLVCTVVCIAQPGYQSRCFYTDCSCGRQVMLLY